MIGKFSNQRPIVGSKVLENYNFLHKISKTKSDKKRNDLLKNSKPIELLTLVEIAKNIKNNKAGYKFHKKSFNRLAPYAECIRKLSRAKSEKAARNLVIQNGSGFLPSLLIPVLAEAAQQIISRYIKK
jgi:hypothetical protein